MRVNMNKTKVMKSGERQKVRQKAVRWPCGVCSKGVGSNSLQCTSYKKWVHKKCSGLKGSMSKVAKSFICRGCLNPLTSAGRTHARTHAHTHTHTHTNPFNGPFSGTTRVSRNQKGKTSLGFTEARDSEWQWHQPGHMQVCTSLQTDNYASTPPDKFFTGRMPFLPPNQQR